MAYVFCADRQKADAIARQLQAGTTMVNVALDTHAVPGTPWQGLKQSGLGQVHSAQGLREAAIGAFVKMRETCGPGDPLLIEAHSMIYRDKPPERAWRRVEPAEALDLRNKAAP